MAGKYRQRKREKFLLKILKMAIFILLCFAAIRIGMLGGSQLTTIDTNVVSRMDANTFKMTLNNSLPMIDTVYNSGNISVSLSGEVKNLVKGIFNFDLSTPLTILNAQSPVLYNYYRKNYRNNVVAKRDDTYKLDYSEREAESRGGESPGDGEGGRNADPNKIEVVQPGATSNEKVVFYNETKIKIGDNDIDQLIKSPLRLKQQKKGPEVLIVHTHTTESYLRDVSDLTKVDVPNRTEDPRYNVVRVGEELAQHLRKKYGIDVIHNGTIHDADFNSAYGMSLSTVDKILKSYPSIRVVIDLHRDAMGGNKKLRTAVKIEGKNAARLMFVIGTNQTLNHPNWKENFKLSTKLQQLLNEQYPGITRPINISFNRYNQHVSNGAIIVEVGGDGDTLDEALESTKYLAKAINDVIN